MLKGKRGGAGGPGIVIVGDFVSPSPMNIKCWISITYKGSNGRLFKQEVLSNFKLEDIGVDPTNWMKAFSQTVKNICGLEVVEYQTIEQVHTSHMNSEVIDAQNDRAKASGQDP